MDFLSDAVVVERDSEAADEQTVDDFEFHVRCDDGIETNFMVPKENLRVYSDLEAEVVVHAQELCYYDLFFYYLDRNGVYNQITNSSNFDRFLETRVNEHIYVIKMETLNWKNCEDIIESPDSCINLGSSTASNYPKKLESTTELTILDSPIDVNPSAGKGMSSAPKRESSTQSDLPETFESSLCMNDSTDHTNLLDCSERTNSSTIPVSFESLDATIGSDFWTSDLDCSTSTTNLEYKTISDSFTNWRPFIRFLDFLMFLLIVIIITIAVTSLTMHYYQESRSETTDPHSDKWTAFKETAQKYCNNHPSTSSNRSLSRSLKMSN